MGQDNSMLKTETGPARSSGLNKTQIGILVVVCVPMFFTVLNASAIGVLLPEIAADLNIGMGQVSWLMTGFLLVYGIAIPFYGRIADIYGAPRLFLIGLVVFAVGSLLSAVAPNFQLLLAARILQAVGGAAIPGLGMAIASRTFPADRQGTVLGVLSATIGVGSAVGPLLAGVMSELLGWRSIFVVTALAALVFPIALKVFSRDESRSDEPLDVTGGLFLGAFVAGALFAMTEGARSGWGSTLVVSAAGISALALVALVIRQRTARFPFLPKELVSNQRYVALVSMSFTVMSVNLAVLIGLPLLLTSLHDLAIAQVGFVLLPGAILTAVFGILSGRLADSIGPRIPVRFGIGLMLVAALGISSYSPSSVLLTTVFVAMLGAGFALVNTPLAAVVTTLVRMQILSMAMSVNTMALFAGGGFGTALLTAIIITRDSDSAISLNPLHSGQGAGFSDAYLILSISLLITMALSLALPSKEREPAQTAAVEVPAKWVPDCSVPWAPGCEEQFASAGGGGRETENRQTG